MRRDLDEHVDVIALQGTVDDGRGHLGANRFMISRTRGRTYPLNAEPDEEELSRLRSHNSHRERLKTYTKPYTVLDLRKIMLYCSITYGSLVPLKICCPLGVRVRVPPSAPAICETRRAIAPTEQLRPTIT